MQKYFDVYSVNDPFFKQTGYNDAVTTCKITDVGIEKSDASSFFQKTVKNLGSLQGVPDLNNSPSVFLPLEIV